MSFGWSVGDLWTAAKEINGLRKKYSDAPKQFRKLFDELTGLARVLEDIDLLIDDPNTLDDRHHKTLQNVVSSCEKVHTDVQSLLQKYIILGETPQTTGQRLKRSWKRLTLEPEDITKLRSRITSTIGLVHATIAIQTSITTSTINTQVSEVNAKLTETKDEVTQIHAAILQIDPKVMLVDDKVSQIISRISLVDGKIFEVITKLGDFDTKAQLVEEAVLQTRAVVAKVDAKVDQVVDYQELERRQSLLQWLSDIQHEALLDDALSRRQPGTGQWLLNSETMQDWINHGESVILVGAPGTGKTIMASIVIEHLQSIFKATPDIKIAYYYWHFNRKHDPSTMLSSILRQFLNQTPNFKSSIDLYSRKLQDKKLSISEIQQLIKESMATSSKSFIVLDGLDECHIIHHLDDVLGFLFPLLSQLNIKLLMTSRPVPDVLELCQSVITEELQAQTMDIEAYIRNAGRKMKLVQRNPKLLDVMVETILKAVDGVFLLAKLHMDSLQDKITVGKLKKALAELPQGSDAYHSAYKNAMARIQSQTAGRSELAMAALTWIVCGSREFVSYQLLHALAIKEGSEQLDLDEFPTMDDVLSVCIGLLTWDVNTNVVRLVHHTAQEYFYRMRNVWFPDGHDTLLKCCLTCLSHNVENLEQRSPEQPFQLQRLTKYAEGMLSHYFQTSNPKLDELSSYFLPQDPNSSSRLKQNPVYHCAMLGLVPYLQELLAKGFDPNQRNAKGFTPLHIAVRKGRMDIIELLLQYPRLDLNSQDSSGKTPLMNLIEAWRLSTGEAALKAFLSSNSVDVNAQDEHGKTVLHFCMSSKGFARDVDRSPIAVQLLLDDGRINVFLKDKFDNTAMDDAAHHADSKTLLKVLLDYVQMKFASKLGEDGQKSEYQPIIQKALESAIEALNITNSQILYKAASTMKLQHLERLLGWPYMSEMVKLLSKRGAEIFSEEGNHTPVALDLSTDDSN